MLFVTLHTKQTFRYRHGAKRPGPGIRALGFRSLLLVVALVLGLGACKPGPVDPHTGEDQKEEESSA